MTNDCRFRPAAIIRSQIFPACSRLLDCSPGGTVISTGSNPALVRLVRRPSPKRDTTFWSEIIAHFGPGKLDRIFRSSLWPCLVQTSRMRLPAWSSRFDPTRAPYELWPNRSDMAVTDYRLRGQGASERIWYSSHFLVSRCENRSRSCSRHGGPPCTH